MKRTLRRRNRGEFTFNLKADNGEAILSASQTYASQDGCEGGIDSVRKNAQVHVEDQTKEGFEELTHPKYELYEDKAGEYRFRLKARNGEIIGRSEGYKAKSSALNGIESVGKNAPDAQVVAEEE